ncbi:DUF1326 domain-containing protein [Pseudodonghicola xiamenensis]|uniref:DUF1326 domain-containing protein n=1 Tax=Pseudodonghicola xiamenensis TaxID=337702 RepID=A0A8J3MCV8_9RHOB|nr:DUF1326 domain-containing protein [Pseudodonghicola xiamenensis]GHG91671.1 hypothetical protein GCM10010961_23160 [Pseudodonghicola xiamenensis]
MKDWAIHGQEIGNCNCNPGCPCQFSQLPTGGSCEALLTFRIDTGHYGDVKLDGLHAACLYKWPGPVHEGNGQMQMIIDESATAEQRAALEAIMTGEDTVEFGTMFYVFSLMSPTRHETLTADISLDYDADTGIGTARVGDLAQTSVKPIPNIVSGEPHVVKISLPDGFEFAEATMACGSTITQDTAIRLEKNTGTHAHIADLHMTGNGIERAA